MEKYLDITKPRYTEHILPVPWHFVISRFHCTNKNASDFNTAKERMEHFYEEKLQGTSRTDAMV